MSKKSLREYNFFTILLICKDVANSNSLVMDFLLSICKSGLVSFKSFWLGGCSQEYLFRFEHPSPRCEGQSYRAVSCPIELWVDDGSRKRILSRPPTRAATGPSYIPLMILWTSEAGCVWVGQSHHIDTYVALS